MKISLRGWLVIGAFSALLLVGAYFGSKASWAADEQATSQAGQLSEADLGRLIQAMGLEPKKEQGRYDFAFKAIRGEDEWELSMSAVLSEDGKSLWVMAWLNELPRSAADVPRTALLRLLADNDRMGNGKFFAYVANNRRFVLQQVVPNQDLTTRTFQGILQDLGASVVTTHPHWAVENWRGNIPSTVQAEPEADSVEQSEDATTESLPRRTVVNESKFHGPVKR